MKRAIHLLAATACVFALIAGVSHAQRGFRTRTARAATAADFDGTFQYCRVVYQSNRGGTGGGWSTDYPDAEANLSIRLSELTKTRVGRDRSGTPNHLIVQIMDDTLFQCPFIMMQEVGALYFDDDEALRLREYFLKGGFLWVDDFWGSYAWEVWEQEIRKVFPADQFAIVDLTLDHPLFRTMFDLHEGIPQVPSINHWVGTGGDTSERGADSAEVHVRGIADAEGRLMVLMTHNTDVSDSWEREGLDPNYFYTFSVPGYGVAMNVLMYTMTH